MTENERDFEPGNNGEETNFDFLSLNAETVDPLVTEFTAPDAKATKNKWWERAPKSNKNPRERRSKSSRTTPPMPKGGLKPALENVYTGIGMSLMPFDPSCGRTVIENAPSCAEALDELAKTNQAVRRILISLVTTSAWGAVIMAHAPIIMAVAMHHVPALKDRQEKMVGEFAEMMANGFGQKQEGEEEK